MGEEEEIITGIVYECIRCGAQTHPRKEREPRFVSCPSCGYKILTKIRPPIVKRVKAI